MARLPFFRRTFRVTRFHRDVLRDVNDEIELYLEMRTQELVDEGWEPDAARRAALAAFGDRRRIETECRRIAEPEGRKRRRAEILGSFLTDVRHALRDMRKRPAFAAVACLTLAVCMALNAAVFGVVRSIVLRPLPFPQSERIVKVWNSYPNAGAPRADNSVPDYFDRRDRIEAFEEVALYQMRTHTLGEPGAIRRSFSMYVTPSFFRVLGVEPFLGRAFTAEEEEPGHDAKVVLGFGLWQDLYGGDPSVLGSDLRIEGVAHTVVGVMPEDFRFPAWDAQLFVPLAFSEEQRSEEARSYVDFEMLARLRPGVSVDQAQSQLEALNAALLDDTPAELRQLIVDAGFTTIVGSFHADLVRGVRPWLLLLWGGALFVLLIGAVSITNLLLVRSTGRLRELATRYVLGAGRGRLVRQLLTESLVLALVGGGLGLFLALWSLRLVNVFEVYEIPRVSEVRIDMAAAAAILLLSLGVMAFSSLVATLAVGRRNLFAVLRSGTSTSGGGHLRLRGGLVAAQIAVAFVLAIGAGLAFSSLRHLMAVDPGFESDGVIAGAFKLPPVFFEGLEDQHRFLAEALAEIRSVPGVTDAAIANQLPFSGWNSGTPLTPEGRAREPGESVLSHFRTAVSPGYFDLMEIPLVSGRAFTEGDDADAAPVVILSEEVARRYWPGADPVGRKIFLGVEPDDDATWHTVVGVVGDVVQNELTETTAKGAYYVPYRQSYMGFTRWVAKTEQEPYSLLPSIRQRVFSIHPEMPVFWVETLEESIAASLIPFRVPMQLLGVFAAVALGLAAVGVYGVLAQSVTQRTREISIRMALGSPRAGIYRWTLRGMLVFVAVGLAFGVGGALSLSRVMTSLLYGVRPSDPGVFGVVGLVIGAVAFFASLVPAQRAMRIDPVKALDAE